MLPRCYHPVNISQGATLLGVLALCFIPWFRRWSYEIFLQGHHTLTSLFVYSTWRIFQSKVPTPQLYLWIALSRKYFTPQGMASTVIRALLCSVSQRQRGVSTKTKRVSLYTFQLWKMKITRFTTTFEINKNNN